jgi:ABC-2 type transport system permease protein
MTGVLIMLWLSLKRARILLIATALLLALFQVLLVLIAGSIQRAGEFDQLASLLPPVARNILGPSLTSVLSFGGIVCLGFYDLGIVIALLALVIAFATVPASEVEIGFADLTLARPVPRHWMITRTIALVLFAIVSMLGVMMGSTWVGLTLYAPENAVWPSPAMIGWFALDLGLLLLCWGGIAMAFGAAYRRSVAGAISGVLALAAFLLDYTGRLWAPAERFAWLSPFRYFIPFDLVMGNPLPWENVCVLWAVAMTGFVMAYFLFTQRDISH